MPAAGIAIDSCLVVIVVITLTLDGERVIGASDAVALYGKRVLLTVANHIELTCAILDVSQSIGYRRVREDDVVLAGVLATEILAVLFILECPARTGLDSLPLVGVGRSVSHITPVNIYVTPLNRIGILQGGHSLRQSRGVAGELLTVGYNVVVGSFLNVGNLLDIATTSSQSLGSCTSLIVGGNVVSIVVAGICA